MVFVYLYIMLRICSVSIYMFFFVCLFTCSLCNCTSCCTTCTNFEKKLHTFAVIASTHRPSIVFGCTLNISGSTTNLVSSTTTVMRSAVLVTADSLQSLEVDAKPSAPSANKAVASLTSNIHRVHAGRYTENLSLSVIEPKTNTTFDSILVNLHLLLFMYMQGLFHSDTTAVNIKCILLISST